MLRQLFVFGSVFVFMVISSVLAGTEFIETDEETGGNWSDLYGDDGYIFCNMNGPLSTIVADKEEIKENDISELPDYIDDYILGGGIQGYVWQIDDKKAKILEAPDGTRNAACWFNGGPYTVDLPLKRNTVYTLAIYIDDWESGGREESITLTNLDTGAELATQDFASFGAIGKYAVFEVDTSVQVIVDYIPSYANAVVSGVFFSGGGAAVDSAGKLATVWGKVKAN